ncbi:MAG: RNA polymerase sigma factor [Bacteroidetes bacterium]|nr:RNA polymerase sigma factor [Bacteroidota bacterium]MBS1685769.1 RNA polymerase sigma factor [Bacteroidota bacterium]
MTEEMLLKGLREQNTMVLREFVAQYQQRVYNTAISFVKDSSDAEELAQDVFLTVWNSIDTFRGDAALATWVYRITVTKSLDLIKSRSRKKRFGFIFSISGENAEVASKTVNWVHPGIIEENREKAGYLFRAIDTLPENQRIAFTLSKVEQMSQREIADVMKLKEGAVESLLQRAKQNLRRSLEDIYKELYD